MPSSHNGHISITGVSKYYGRHKALDDVSLEIPPGTVTVILGPSGSGKSTLLRTINHLERVDEGFIQIDGDYIGYRRKGDKLYEMKEKEILRQRINVGYVFQNFNLFPHLTVLENLIEAPIAHKQVTRKEAIARAWELLDVVGLRNKADAWSRHLSGGQQQRIAIARALALDPRVILFDEPTSALDPELMGEVLDVIKKLARSGTTLVVVTHEIGFAREVADQVVFMVDGRIVEQGSSDEVLNHPQHPRTRHIQGAAVMKRALMTLILSAFAMSVHAALDLRANEQPLPVTRDPQAIAKIPPGYRFVEPGTLTVAISALNSPPLALLASDNRTRIGSDPDMARLLAGSLGLKLRLVPTAWEDWPLGIASGRYDVALINIAVTEKRKEKFDFATYRVDSLAFSVKSTSDIAAINGPADLAGRKVIVGSGTNQERILLGWNEDNRAAGRPQAQPVYLTDDASGNLYIQSGRADIFFGPQSVAAYKAALNGQTRVVGLGPKKAWVATTTKKGNGLVYALQAALDGAIARGEYQQVLARWGEQGEAVTQSVVNPAGITY